MKTILLVVIVFAILGAVIFIVLPSVATVPESKPSPSATIITTQQTHGDYLPYSKSVLDNAASKRRVLFFYANWCPTCRPADSSFTQNTSQIPVDVVLIRVNYNDTQTDQEEKDLAAKYGVTYQHTFVQIDESGNEVTKWNGGQIEELLTNLK